MASLLRPSIYWLFVFAPVSLALDYSGASAPLIFFSAALSIIPIAKLDCQRGLFIGGALGNWSLTGYAYNIDRPEPFVLFTLAAEF